MIGYCITYVRGPILEDIGATVHLCVDALFPGDTLETDASREESRECFREFLVYTSAS